MKSVLEEAGEAVDHANVVIGGLLDLTEVPDHHPLRGRISAALVELDDLLRELPSAARRASRLNESGPMVFVSRKSDMRHWPTTEGRVAGLSIVPHVSRVRTAASSKKRIAAPRSLLATKRRVLTWKEYVQYLEESTETSKQPT
jgi:hypothetical protein